MKNLICLFVILFCTNLFSQETERNTPFTNFKLGFLAGINISKLTGGSVLIEGKINLTSHINAKVFAGYSNIIKQEGYNVKTYGFNNLASSLNYSTVSYNVDRIDYDVFPLGIGFEYLITENSFSPYAILEAGYNYYSYHVQQSNYNVGFAGYYNTFDEIPSEYKNKPPANSNANSYLLGLGIGTNYKLSSVINLDIRYVYQVNKSIVNTNQILIGINF